MELVNETPFRAERVALADAEGRDLLVVIVKGTFRFNGPRPPSIAEEQVPIQLADEFHGEPGESSVRYESDISPVKPDTDVVLLGHAYSPRGMMPFVDVSLTVGPLKKVCRVFGNRTWKNGIMGPVIPSPQPFEKIPLVYERAFGGKDLSAPREDQHESEDRNPVGTGLLARKSTLDVSQVALPNLEDPAALISGRNDRPPPTGFGFIGRGWKPRMNLAGTYDDAWEKERSPLLPENFDPRYYNGAHPDLIMQGHLAGDEPVELQNASPDGLLRFAVPRVDLRVVTVSNTWEPTVLEMSADTLVLEPDEGRMTITWRGSQIVQGQLTKIGMVRVRANV
jgi:hypothetical protein